MAPVPGKPRTGLPKLQQKKREREKNESAAYKNSPFAAHVAVAETDWGVLHNELELSRAGFREPVCLGEQIRAICFRALRRIKRGASAPAVEPELDLSEAEGRPNRRPFEWRVHN